MTYQLYTLCKDGCVYTLDTDDEFIAEGKTLYDIAAVCSQIIKELNLPSPKVYIATEFFEVEAFADRYDIILLFYDAWSSELVDIFSSLSEFGVKVEHLES